MLPLYVRAVIMARMNEAHQPRLKPIDEARAFHRGHGHLRVPKDFVSQTGFPLGEWIRNRRKNFVAGRLEPQRQAQLDALGMVWVARDELWAKGLNEAKQNHAAHGHLRVGQNHVTEEGFQLGAWLKARRRDFAKEKLSPHKQAMLDSLGMSWEQASRDGRDRARRAHSGSDGRTHRTSPARHKSSPKAADPAADPEAPGRGAIGRGVPWGVVRSQALPNMSALPELDALCLTWGRPGHGGMALRGGADMFGAIVGAMAGI
jgi:hypothetical protein